jgi:uncharacterized protein YgbK (DUF1537 family)
LRAGGLSVLYKKLDSTGQGNLVAEVEAARDAGGFATALVCPANPAQGRIVRGGVLHVRGGDTVNLQERFRAQGLIALGAIASPISAMKVTRATKQNRPFILADATSERDLACLARAGFKSKQPILLVGSAGMAGQLAKLMRDCESGPLHPNGKIPPSRAGKLARGKTLLINGSNSEVTGRQLEKLVGKTDAASLALNHGTSKDAAAALASGRNVIIRVPVHRQPDHVVLRQLSALAELFRARLVGSLLLTGGDTALLVCRCLRPRAIAIRGEVVPGIAWGKFVGGLADGLTVCTKPGGFGNDQSIVRAVAFLARVTADVSPGKSGAWSPRALVTPPTPAGGRKRAATGHSTS